VLDDQRHLFETDDDVAYFNAAAVSPLLRSVREAGLGGLRWRAEPWNFRPDDWFGPAEELRATVARLMGSAPDGIAFVPATSYGLAVAARNLPIGAGSRILALQGEFPSSYHTWQRAAERAGAELVLVDRKPEESWTDAVVGAVDERTAVVVAPNVHWTNGAWVDLDAVGRAARHAGAAFVVDASQSLGAVPVDVAALRPDFLVSVGYKWQLGPLGLSYLHVDESHRDGEPLEENWITRQGADDFASLVDYVDEYAPGARRYDMGHRSNPSLMPMAQAALDQLLAWGVDQVAVTLDRLTSGIADRVAALGLGVAPRDRRGPHILGVDLPPGAAPRVSAALQERHVVASARGSSLRLAPHLHTSASDVDRLVDALATAL
jgi:selenocysteine lyase/cysteine desulfurase